MKISPRTGTLTALLSLVFVTWANYYSFVLAPTERIMGPVQRIFYYHVAGAITTYILLAVMFCAGVLYLLKEEALFEDLGAAAASVAFLFASIVLTTGMIWGHSAWNVWWRWEPRLVSFLILWLILLSTLLVKSFLYGDSRQGRFSAVLAIIAAVNVPLVIFSVRFMEASEQLHPQVVANQGLRDPRFGYGLLYAVIASVAVAVVLLLVRFFQLREERTITNLERDVDGVL